MAGTRPGFNGDAFRDGIHTVMAMGAPVNASDRATFYLPGTLVYNVPTDADNVPFDPDAMPVTNEPAAPVVVRCAVEYFDAAGNPTDFGLMVPAKATITVLDEDWAPIENFIYVMLGGERFSRVHVEMPSALFDVGVITVHVASDGVR